MNKTELAKKVAKETGLAQRDAAAAVNAVFSGIEETLASGEDVSILGFGRFALVARPVRQVRNPQSGALIDIPAGLNVRFRVGAGLKRAVDH
ncbi:DNA-binding protein [Halorhodospira abdelmalekii]|uniref:HU family DNA-binding protein n=1 Tax=Halorhodospira abdelmalekii TaxID=421629 RepID=UPI001903D56E|nr:DNA-binding protein [Halorhodospira abdelmalekii]